MAYRKVLDTFFFGYFAFQVPSTLFLDTQGMFPQWMYPQFMREIGASYLGDFRDPFLGDVRSFPWYMAICVVEFTLEIPFFFVATYAYYKGAAQCPWIRIPSLLYGVHTATAVLGVLFSICFEDFSRYSVPAPRDFRERTRLFCVYVLFVIAAVVLILDTCFSSAYIRDKKKAE